MATILCTEAHDTALKQAQSKIMDTIGITATVNVAIGIAAAELDSRKAFEGDKLVTWLGEGVASPRVNNTVWHPEMTPVLTARTGKLGRRFVEAAPGTLVEQRLTSRVGKPSALDLPYNLSWTIYLILRVYGEG